MLVSSKLILYLFVKHFLLGSWQWDNNTGLPLGFFHVLAAASKHHNYLFVRAPGRFMKGKRMSITMQRVKGVPENVTATESGNSLNDDLPAGDPTAGDRSLDQWKADMADVPGSWRIFYPLSLSEATGLSPNADIRPSMLFCDISGRVTGPEHEDSGQGSFILDAKESVELDDGETFVHNRKIAMVILSSKNYSNLRLALLGRIFYSKQYLFNELDGAVQMRAALIVGQAFIESYRNNELADSLERIKRRITVVDSEGNEVDPLTWEYQPLNVPGSPFRWMHGTDEWKLLGPFTAYRALGSKVNVPHAPMMLDKYDVAAMYNTVDPLKLNKTKYTKPSMIEEETQRVIEAVFGTEEKGDFCIKDKSYMNQLYEEMVQLAKVGPDLYKGSME